MRLCQPPMYKRRPASPFVPSHTHSLSHTPMSVFSKFTTFLKTTLFSIRAFLLRPFARMRSPAMHTCAVNPYPLAPDLENRIMDIVHDTQCEIGYNKGLDLEKGVFGVASPCQSTCHAAQNASFAEIGAHSGPNSAHVSPTPASRIIRPSSVVSIVKHAQKVAAPVPLSIVTNFARIPGSPRRHVQSKSQNENTSPTPLQARRKPTPLRRMPRYLNLTGASPTKSPCVKTPPSGSKSRRSSVVSFANSPVSRKSPRDSGYGASPFITPLKLESGLPSESPDWATRVRSAFYKRRQDDYDDEHDDVRDFFNRDSKYSGVTLDYAMDAITKLDSQEDSEDDEVDYGRPISVRSTCYSPSREASSDISFNGHKRLLPSLPCAVSSELPYLRESNTGLSLSSSMSSGAFDDLLASVERKYPGQDWSEIVKFADDEEGINGTPQDEQWSDIFGLDEYAV
ncbi:hypothetical protein C8R43DRAFT_528403 [Mycena crocata]|nr:hypothetical protein C8R43DRAFT_528403 [Mycena crocata]